MNCKSLSPDEARREFFPQIGRAAFYEALRRGDIPHLRVGRKIVIPRNALEDLFQKCAKDGRNPSLGCR